MNEQTRHTLDFISQKWMLHVLMILLRGPHTFCDLARRLEGMSDPILSKRLKELLCEGVIERDVMPGPPIQVVYRLTRKGDALRGVMSGLEDWSDYREA